MLGFLGNHEIVFFDEGLGFGGVEGDHGFSDTAFVTIISNS